MLRLITCLLYISGYLIYSIPRLMRMKKLPEDMPVKQKDLIIHETPKQWSKTIMKLAGSEIETYGSHLIPDGPVLLVSNHEGDFDIPVLLSSIEKPFGFISKVEIKKIPLLSSWMETIHCVFLDRKDKKNSAVSINAGVELLKKGHSLVIFPEGTRSKGGSIGLFKAGGLRLAVESGVPIVPISIEGTADVFEKNGRFVRPAKIKVMISSPIYKSEYKDKDLKVLADEVREIIIDSRRKKRIAS